VAVGRFAEAKRPAAAAQHGRPSLAPPPGLRLPPISSHRQHIPSPAHRPRGTCGRAQRWIDRHPAHPYGFRIPAPASVLTRPASGVDRQVFGAGGARLLHDE
jgi:hypothetical protein